MFSSPPPWTVASRQALNEVPVAVNEKVCIALVLAPRSNAMVNGLDVPSSTRKSPSPSFTRSDPFRELTVAVPETEFPGSNVATVSVTGQVVVTTGTVPATAAGASTTAVVAVAEANAANTAVAAAHRLLKAIPLAQ
jgi:hypothetical protein